MDHRQDCQEFNHLMSAVADLMNGWTCQPGDAELSSYPHVKLIHADGFTLWCRKVWGMFDKFRVSGEPPASLDGYRFDDSARRNLTLTWPEANISLEKTPRRIVADIERRILPDYIPLYLEADRIKQEYLERKGQEKILFDRMVALTGASTSQASVRRSSAYVVFPGDVHVDFSVSGNKVHIERLSDLTPEQAERVFKALKN